MFFETKQTKYFLVIVPTVFLFESNLVDLPDRVLCSTSFVYRLKWRRRNSGLWYSTKISSDTFSDNFDLDQKNLQSAYLCFLCTSFPLQAIFTSIRNIVHLFKMTGEAITQQVTLLPNTQRNDCVFFYFRT